MYISCGVRTPFSLHKKEFSLLKGYNLGATALRALISMLPNQATDNIPSLICSDNGENGIVEDIIQRVGLENVVGQVVNSAADGLLSAFKGEVNTFLLGVASSFRDVGEVISDGDYCVPVNPFKDSCVKDISESERAQALLHARKKCAEAAKDAFLYEIAPIALHVEKKVSHYDLDTLITTPLPSASDQGVPIRYRAPLCDGAAALCLTTEPLKQTLARIVGGSCSDVVGHEALVVSIEKLLKDHSVALKDVKIFEIDERVVCAPKWCANKIGIAPEYINRWGGSCALGDAGSAEELRMVLSAAQGMHALSTPYAVVARGKAALLLERYDDKK
ncbi:MAG: hypothetical protein OXC30_02890 [Alphaproteobacteria bacterium]|nr:hypothetical protein [Alphaproteobacteria bacterium]